MPFEGKKILFLCKESYSYPLYFLAEKWRETNTVASYFFMPAECVYKKTLLNEITYFKFKELNNLEIFDVTDIAAKFTDNIKKPTINYKYMEEIEENYTHFKNLNLQLMSSQFTTNYYHDRFYFDDFTYEQQIYWLELNYRNAIKIFDEFKPDVILDLDDAELPRTIINEIAYKKNIPYITLEHPRYEFYKYPTFNMGIGIDGYFKKLYESIMNDSEEKLQEEMTYINDYREKISIMPDEYKNTTTAQYKKDGLLKLCKTLVGKVLYFWNQDFSSGNYKIKQRNKKIYPASIKYILFYFFVEFKKRLLFNENRYFDNPVEGENYVYMPLHLIPESTTFVKAPLYVNELFVIEEISKSLPIGWVLYVKEHQAMLGERSFNFYKKIRQLPNVKIVAVNYYKDPKPWILKSKGVITISGTSAFEAALLGKKSIVFGEVPFSLIEGITRIDSFEQLPKLIKEFGQIENIHSCAAYIAAVKKSGAEVKLKYLMSEGEKILLDKMKMNDEYKSELKVLEKFYEIAYHNFLDRNRE